MPLMMALEERDLSAFYQKTGCSIVGTEPFQQPSHGRMTRNDIDCPMMVKQIAPRDGAKL